MEDFGLEDSTGPNPIVKGKQSQKSTNSHCPIGDK